MAANLIKAVGRQADEGEAWLVIELKVPTGTKILRHSRKTTLAKAQGNTYKNTLKFYEGISTESRHTAK